MAGTVEITGGRELLAVAAELQRIPAATQVRLRTRMQPVAGAMKAAVQRNALSIPARGTSGTGLRRSIAGATRIQVTVTSREVTARVYVDPDAMPPGQATLPTVMEGPSWTHEVYGHPMRVIQFGHQYFKPAVASLMPTMRTAVDRAVDDAFRTIR